MNKFKIKIKGDENGFSVESDGNVAMVISVLMQLACDMFIENGMTKKEFLEANKNVYEVVMEHKNKEVGEK